MSANAILPRAFVLLLEMLLGTHGCLDPFPSLVAMVRGRRGVYQAYGSLFCFCVSFSQGTSLCPLLTRVSPDYRATAPFPLCLLLG